MRRHLAALVVGALVLGAAGGAMYLAIKWAYGGFDDTYRLSVDLPRAGQQLQVGSDVRVRGVVVGHVESIDLVDRRARLTLEIEDRHRIPREARAVISLKTLLGAKFVDLRFSGNDGPYLLDGDKVAAGHVGPELEDALEDGVSVLAAIRPSDLATVISELATAARGHGDDVARSLRANARLSGLFARTVDEQLEALRDFRVVFGALEERAVDLNALADAINEGVPVYASPKAQRALRRSLEALVPFSDHLADLLILNREDWDRLMDEGDVVLQTIADRPDGLHDLVWGLYRYVFKLGGNPKPLPDGSGAAGFVNFIGGNDQEEEWRQLCTALPVDVRPHVPLCHGGTL
ncbi:MAG: MCE family protein [Actinobacteria bacterium]|nr:MCE family protein [Actinomycetota bacterium]